MPDKKLTDNEIIKAYELCFAEKGTKQTCGKCPYHKFGKLCKVRRDRDALDLINRLQAENERLKPFEDKIAEFKSHIRVEDMLVFASSLEEWLEFCDNLKAEAYKKCIEKAKNEIESQSHSRSLEASGERFRIHKILDNLLKELVGDDNAN